MSSHLTLGRKQIRKFPIISKYSFTTPTVHNIPITGTSYQNSPSSILRWRSSRSEGSISSHSGELHTTRQRDRNKQRMRHKTHKQETNTLRKNKLRNLSTQGHWCNICGWTHSLVTPGTSPLHLAPRVTYSD